MLEDENDKQVQIRTGESLKKKDMSKEKRGNGYVLTLNYYLKGSLVKIQRGNYFK